MQMGFNFGQFLGGMSRQISENIESAKEFEREKQFRLDMLAEEEATKMRLQRSAERRAQRKKDTENASVLKAMGYTDAQAGWIMKGGDATVSLYTKFAEQAFTRGISPSTILGSNLVNSDQQDPRNEAALMSVIDSTRPEIDPDDQPFTIRQDVMTSVLGEIKEPKEPELYTSLAAGYSGTFTELLSARQKAKANPSEANKADVTRLEGVLADWKAQIEEDIQMRKPDEKPDKPIKYFSDTSRETIKKNAFADAYTEYDFETDINGNITANLEGRQAAKIVARIAAADTIERQANVAEGVVDTNLQNEADKIREKALDALSKYGQAIVTQKGGTDNKTKTFGYLKTTRENPENNYDMHVKGNSGEYKIGDVVIAEEPDGSGGTVLKVYVYTGMKDPNDSGYKDRNNRILFNYFHDAGQLY
jgi:hypothetical protein